MIGDHLRPPGPIDPTANRYKDWLHLNLMHHGSGAIGLVNLSLHGPPDDPRSRVVGIAAVNQPGEGWIGQAEIRGFDEAAISDRTIALGNIALAIADTGGEVLSSVIMPSDGVSLQVTAVPSASPIVIDEQLPLGTGWISWRATPRLSLAGKMNLGDRMLDLSDASGYHDHNWGRWYWGDDFGWEWACFLTPPPGPCFVMSRTTDRAHRHPGPLTLSADVGRTRRTFVAPHAQVEYAGELEPLTRRLPGAMAALHQGRARVRLPHTARLRADDGKYSVAIEYTGRSALQVITADPIAAGYGFIHEIAGEFECEYKNGDGCYSGRGLAILEYVD